MHKSIRSLVHHRCAIIVLYWQCMTCRNLVKEGITGMYQSGEGGREVHIATWINPTLQNLQRQLLWFLNCLLCLTIQGMAQDGAWTPRNGRSPRHPLNETLEMYGHNISVPIGTLSTHVIREHTGRPPVLPPTQRLTHGSRPLPQVPHQVVVLNVLSHSRCQISATSKSDGLVLASRAPPQELLLLVVRKSWYSAPEKKTAHWQLPLQQNAPEGIHVYYSLFDFTWALENLFH